MTTPTASAVRAAQAGSRFRAVFTPSTTAPIISSRPMTAAPGASSASATSIPKTPIARARATRAAAFTLFVTMDVISTTVTESRPRKSSPNHERALRFE
jgi:hypothetical protein